MVDEDGDELEVSSEELVEGDLSATYEIEGDTLLRKRSHSTWV